MLLTAVACVCGADEYNFRTDLVVTELMREAPSKPPAVKQPDTFRVNRPAGDMTPDCIFPTQLVQKKQ